jgi:hypothetical protein
MLRGGNFLEQTGYEIKSLRKIALYSPFGHFSRTTHFFEATIIGKSATLSKKDPRSPFFLLAALPKNLVPLYHDLIKDALDPNCPTKKKKKKKPMPRLYWIRDWKFVYNPCIFVPFLWGRLCWWLTNKPLFK